MEDLEEDLTCSVCFGLFSDPRVLPCSHTFCRSCLESVLQASVSFSIWRPLRLPLKCPSCRSVTELPSNGVDALPVNVCLRAIVEKYQSDGRPRCPACPEHPRQPLNVYCVQVQLGLVPHVTSAFISPLAFNPRRQKSLLFNAPVKFEILLFFQTSGKKTLKIHSVSFIALYLFVYYTFLKTVSQNKFLRLQSHKSALL